MKLLTREQLKRANHFLSIMEVKANRCPKFNEWVFLQWLERRTHYDLTISKEFQ